MYKHKNGLTLKKIEKEDLEDLKNLKNESWFGTHNITFVNSEDQLKWFNSLNPNKDIILISYDSNTNQKIGLYKVNEIDWVNRKCSEGHDVFESARGLGYGKLLLEAGIDFVFEVLNMQRVEAEVLENNIASQKCCDYVGYTKEGVKRKSIHKCGEYLDSFMYGMLRNEWCELERVKKYGNICNTSYIPKNKKTYDK